MTTTEPPAEVPVIQAYKPDLVLYHSNCADGFGAAWACWMRWRDACEYRPASYGEAPPDVAGKHVLLVDFSYKRDVLQAMANVAASVVILDHHKTAEADLEPFAFKESSPGAISPADVPGMFRDLAELNRPAVVAIFDMDRSGAHMAWDFCHGNDFPPPRLIDLIEDRDLWRFWLEDTKPFSLWLRARPFDFVEWEMIAQEMGDADDSHRIMTEAAAMQTFSDQIVSDIASRARFISILGFDVPAVDCPPNFASEVCHALLVKNPSAPFAAAYSDNPNGKRGWSLRSQDHRQDVSEIAKRFGGGGHRNAAGFGVPFIDASLTPTPTPPSTEAQGEGEVRNRIVYLLQCDNAAMAEALRQCRDQFAFYAREHYAAGKSEKGDTNTRFADIANKPLQAIKPNDAARHRQQSSASGVGECRAAVARLIEDEVRAYRSAQDAATTERGKLYRMGQKDALILIAREIDAILATRSTAGQPDGALHTIVRALRIRMATACDHTRAGKDHVKVRTADWHVLMQLGDEARAALAANVQPEVGK